MAGNRPEGREPEQARHDARQRDRLLARQQRERGPAGTAREGERITAPCRSTRGPGRVQQHQRGTAERHECAAERVDVNPAHLDQFRGDDEQHRPRIGDERHLRCRGEPQRHEVASDRAEHEHRTAYPYAQRYGDRVAIATTRKTADRPGRQGRDTGDHRGELQRRHGPGEFGEHGREAPQHHRDRGRYHASDGRMEWIPAAESALHLEHPPGLRSLTAAHSSNSISINPTNSY